MRLSMWHSDTVTEPSRAEGSPPRFAFCGKLGLCVLEPTELCFCGYPVALTLCLQQTEQSFSRAPPTHKSPKEIICPRWCMAGMWHCSYCWHLCKAVQFCTVPLTKLIWALCCCSRADLSLLITYLFMLWRYSTLQNHFLKQEILFLRREKKSV